VINRSKTWDTPSAVTAPDAAAMFGTRVALTIWAVGNPADTAHMSAFDPTHSHLQAQGPSTYDSQESVAHHTVLVLPRKTLAKKYPDRVGDPVCNHV
jgi:hypothetical protein